MCSKAHLESRIFLSDSCRRAAASSAWANTNASCTMHKCGPLHDLSFPMSRVISSLLTKLCHSLPSWLCCPNFCLTRSFFCATSDLHAKPSKILAGRQLCIIKRWIRAYFLPTQTVVVAGRACWLYVWSHFLLESVKNPTTVFSRKTVDSPAHPHVNSMPGSTKLGCCRLKFLQ